MLMKSKSLLVSPPVLALAISVVAIGGLPQVSGAASPKTAKSAAKQTTKATSKSASKQAATKVAKDSTGVVNPSDVKVAPNKPALFIAAKAQKVITALKRRPLRINEHQDGAKEVSAAASKQSWVQAVYKNDLVESSWASQMLSDKRILAEVIEREMGDSARTFYPKTMGLREFLAKHNLVNKKGVITASGDQIDEALFSEFPAGFVVRPAVGVAPQETGQGLYRDSDLFVVDLLRTESPLYSPVHMKQAVKSHILDTIASGEAIVIQEDVMRVADAKRPLKTRFFQEVRVHTYENRVVEGAIPMRWVQTNLLKPEQIRQAEIRVGEFLKSLSLELLNRQAWGVDVAVMDNGEMRVIDIVTNRGREVAWSGYLDQPRVIGAYSRHFETFYGLKFEGWSGTLIRNNFANYLPFWEKKIEKAKPGWKKAVAYLPPMP